MLLPIRNDNEMFMEITIQKPKEQTGKVLQIIFTSVPVAVCMRMLVRIKNFIKALQSFIHEDSKRIAWIYGDS